MKVIYESHLWKSSMKVIHASHPWKSSMKVVHESCPWKSSMKVIHESYPWKSFMKIIHESHCAGGCSCIWWQGMNIIVCHCCELHNDSKNNVPYINTKYSVKKYQDKVFQGCGCACKDYLLCRADAQSFFYWPPEVLLSLEGKIWNLCMHSCSLGRHQSWYCFSQNITFS